MMRNTIVRRIALAAGLVIGGTIILTAPFLVILGPSQDKDGFFLILGKNQDQLCIQGAVEYPKEKVGSNHPAHRLAARIMTERYGPLTALAGGVANEVVEATVVTLWGLNPLEPAYVAEQWGDLGANWRGVKDALMED
jgi:hypothetical protein